LYIGTVLGADNARPRERIEAVRAVLLVRLLDLTDSAEHDLKAVEDDCAPCYPQAGEAVRCRSLRLLQLPACQASGNTLRGIIVRYECGPTRVHYVRCPYCARELEIELNAKKVWFVQRDG